MAKKERVRRKTVKEVYDMLQKMIDEGHADEPFKVSVPFRDGIGLHYENVVNITAHSGFVDLHTTMPQDDDVEKPHG